MCWIGNESDVKVAKEDVKVLKVFYANMKTWAALDRKFVRKLYSAVYWSEYRAGEEYHAYIEPHVYDDKVVINEGIHSYSYDTIFKQNKKNILKVYSKTGVSVFSYHPHTAFNSTSWVVYTCIIPAGTVYYENKRGEIVSERLKIISINSKYDYEG